MRKNLCKDNPYHLPRTLYKLVIAIIRDYKRQREEVNNILFGSHFPEISVKGGSPKSAVESMVARLEKYTTNTTAVEKAVDKIPPEYQKGVFENIADGKRFPEGACYKTWLRWRKKFIWYTAEELKLV